MHSKLKGTLGELVVASDLVEKGFPIFKEFGDSSRIDLIALVDKNLIKIQVKCTFSTDNKVAIDTRKSGPNYSFRYEEGDVDIFALYVKDKKSILYISSKQLLQHPSSMTLRFGKSKNSQIKGINNAEDYIDFKKALRDYTQNIPSDNAEDEEIVQTTTIINGSTKVEVVG